MAIALVAKQRTELEEQEKRLSHVVTSLCLDRVGMDIWEDYKKMPDYFKTSKTASLSGLGWDYEHIELTEKIPSENYNFNLVFETKEHEQTANALRKEYDAYEKAKKELRNLRSDIENTVYALKTLKAISEHFPEALPHLPKTPNTSLIIDTTALRKRLK